jgi:phosphatidate cytidylyltransferase
MKPPLAELSNLGQRVVAASAGFLLIVWAIGYADWSFALLFAAISVLTQLEFYRLLELDGHRPLTNYGCALGVFICGLAYFVESRVLDADQFFWLCPAVAVVFLSKLYQPGDLRPLPGIAMTLLGVVYVAVPFSLLLVLGLRDGTYHPVQILGCMLLLFANDTGAYFAGRRFGRHQLFGRVSPKKTWEGSVGGTVLAAFVAFLLGQFTREPGLDRWHWFALGTIIVVAGTYGDLVESLFKRSLAIKDSGNAIPGHGGFLDRFDGLLLAAPFLITFLKLFA